MLPACPVERDVAQAMAAEKCDATNVLRVFHATERRSEGRGADGSKKSRLTGDPLDCRVRPLQVPERWAVLHLDFH
jgi:hypothetical protein